uniref:Uncharacterized protein n=1 Tax=Arundo donax TaxID=35708 RepID=A0A0A9A1D3_ARUDO
MLVMNSPPDPRYFLCASAFQVGAMCISNSAHTPDRISQQCSSPS